MEEGENNRVELKVGEITQGEFIILERLRIIEEKLDVIGNIVYDKLITDEEKRSKNKDKNKKSRGKASTEKVTNVEPKIDGE